MGEVVHGEEHGMALLLDGVERFIVANMNLGIEVVGGNGGYGCSCIGCSSGLLRHVWGGRNECGFPKDKTDKGCFYKQEMKKRKEKKMKIQNCYSTISSSSFGCPQPDTI
jgi:hypothetical protein